MSELRSDARVATSRKPAPRAVREIFASILFMYARVTAMATRGSGPADDTRWVKKTRPQEKDMSNTIRLVAVAMLAILVGCGQGKDASATKASEAAGKAMDSASDAASSAKDAAAASADAMAEGAKAAGDATSSAMDSASDTAADATDDVNNAMDAASDAASDAADSASAAAQSAKDAAEAAKKGT